MIKKKILNKIANQIIDYSLSIGKGDKVLIEASFVPSDFVESLTNAIRKKKAYPYVITISKYNARLQELFSDTLFDDPSFLRLKMIFSQFLQKIDAFIAIQRPRFQRNYDQFLRSKIDSRLKDIISNISFKKLWYDKRWIVVHYPNWLLSKKHGLDVEKHVAMYCSACLLNYRKLGKIAKRLQKRMENANKIRIKGPETDLELDKNNQPVQIGAGDANLPDGECFTAPQKYSVNGEILFNAPTTIEGVDIEFDYLKFEFKNGKIVKIESDQSERIEQLLCVDEGAKYVGEFAISFNPYMEYPIFSYYNEKLSGALHLGIGNSFPGIDNRNRSSIHLDFVQIQTERFGGGEIYFDGELIRKNGYFVPKNLQCLNPEKLKKLVR